MAALCAFGVPGSTITRRCRDGGPWRPLLPGIVLLTSGAPTRNQQVEAALMYGGPRAVLTGIEACRRHGVRRGPEARGTLHLLVPPERQLRATAVVVVERTKRLPEPVVVSGVPLAPVPRACLDAARRLRSRAEIAELLADAVQRRLCTVDELCMELAMGSQRGSAAPRRVLADVSAGVRSAAEMTARRLVAASDLPEPWWNARIYDVNGRLLGIADAWFDDVGLCWEINSYAYHLLPEDFARTTKRSARMTAAGVSVLPALPTELRDNPRAAMADLRAAHRAAALRPRPPVRAVPSTARNESGFGCI